MFGHFLVALIVAIPVVVVPALFLRPSRKDPAQIRRGTGQAVPKPPA